MTHLRGLKLDNNERIEQDEPFDTEIYDHRFQAVKQLLDGLQH